jgi:peroxiredoxin
MMFRSALSLVAAMLLTAGALAADKAVDVGQKAPDFKATGIDGKVYTLKSAEESKALVVCFTCNACPVAQAYQERFIDFTKEYEDKGVKFIAINVNPESLDDMKKRAEEVGFNFVYAQDESGASAKAYGARVTPHIFLIDKEGKVAYIGAFDDSPDDASKVKKDYLRDAVNAVLEGKTPEVTKTREVGCGIRIKS